MHFDPEEFGKAMGDIVREVSESLTKKIEIISSELASLKADIAIAAASKQSESVTIEIEDITKAVLEAPDAIKKAVREYLEDNPPAAGKDGLGVAGFLKNHEGHLIATTSDGKVHDLGRVDGADGFSPDDISLSFDPDEGHIITFKNGDKEKSIAFPIAKHVGFYNDGMRVKAGNYTTHDGSLWLALRDTKSAPSLSNREDWMLAARKGRDGTPAPVKVG